MKDFKKGDTVYVISAGTVKSAKIVDTTTLYGGIFVAYRVLIDGTVSPILIGKNRICETADDALFDLNIRR